MANPRLKNRVQFTTSTTPNLLKDFQKLSEDTRITMSRLMDEALEDLLKKYEGKK
ncbi:MAG: ribbon-helix-helix domain-containing protein [Bacillota bacterium]